MEEQKKQQLPEAPVSATVKIKSPRGFEWLFTMRSETGKDLNQRMSFMEDKWVNEGWTPIAQNSFKRQEKPKEYIEGRTCPKDNGRLLKPPVGSKWVAKCENNKWNPTLKRSEGCTYIEWQNTQNEDY